MKDKNGREYAKLANLKAGDEVETEGLHCIVDKQKLVVRQEENGDLFIECSAGKHFLAGQIDDDTCEYLIGMYPVIS